MRTDNQRRWLRRLTIVLCWGALVAALRFATGAEPTEDSASVETRLKKSVEYLASDDLGGRGVGEKGIDRAAEYIAGQFKQTGLKTDLFDGTPFQTFPMRPRSDAPQFRVDWKVLFHKDTKQASNSPPRDEPAVMPGGPEQSAGKPSTAVAKNVVAILEGQGPLANETIVVGAHYDHLGTHRGEDGRPVIYNGANDNASGVATMMEIARILSARPEKLPRRVVFVAFTAEERGLVGSFYYVKHPPVPLRTTIAMLNLDMVGRPREDSLSVSNTDNSPILGHLVHRAAGENGLTLNELPTKVVGSDHLPFYAHRIPAVQFMTMGGFDVYHGPGDDPQTLDYAWMGRIAGILAELTVAIAEAPERPTFVEGGLGDGLLSGTVRLLGNLTTPAADAKTPPSPPADKTAAPKPGK